MTGSFVSVDPVLAASDPGQWNGYAYGGGNPVGHADPSGLRYPSQIANGPDSYGCTGSCGWSNRAASAYDWWYEHVHLPALNAAWAASQRALAAQRAVAARDAQLARQEAWWRVTHDGGRSVTRPRPAPRPSPRPQARSALFTPGRDSAVDVPGGTIVDGQERVTMTPPAATMTLDGLQHLTLGMGGCLWSAKVAWVAGAAAQDAGMARRSGSAPCQPVRFIRGGVTAAPAGVPSGR